MSQVIEYWFKVHWTSVNQKSSSMVSVVAPWFWVTTTIKINKTPVHPSHPFWQRSCIFITPLNLLLHRTFLPLPSLWSLIYSRLFHSLSLSVSLSVFSNYSPPFQNYASHSPNPFHLFLIIQTIVSRANYFQTIIIESKTIFNQTTVEKPIPK